MSDDNQHQTTLMDVQERANKLYRGVALAPMVRASTIPLRTLALEYGADFVYTEELVDRSINESVRTENEALKTIDYVKDTTGLSEKAKKRLLKDGGNSALTLRIDPQVEANKLVCQMGTGEPELALEAAKRVYKDVSSIDINMGCPKKFSVSGGMGSALLSDPDRACRIIRTLRNELPTTPVSCKIRLLKDVQSTLDFCQAMIERGGANAIAIHGRRVGDESMESARWDELKEVVSLLRSKHDTFPILLNGDFYTRKDWTEFMEETGASGVLLARPALYNTSIFCKPTDPSLPLSEYSYKSPLLLDKTRVIQDYLRHALHYNGHYKNVKYVICEMMNNRRAPTPRVPYLTQEYSEGRTIGTTCTCRSMQDLCKLWNVQYTQVGGALPGEHRYEDSYFLNGQHQIYHQDKETPPIKRPRLEEGEAATS